MIRRLLAVLLLAGSTLVALGAVAAPADAARCPAPVAGLANRAKAAADVFSGVVLSRAESGSTLSYTVRVERVYKGEISTEQVTVTTDTRPRACGLPALTTGGKYVFFTQESGGELTTGRGTGTSAATAEYVARVERVLGSGRPPVAVAPPPAKVTFTTVADEPRDLQRMAAPGVAIVILGLLGLVLVSWRGRRRT